MPPTVEDPTGAQDFTRWAIPLVSALIVLALGAAAFLAFELYGRPWLEGPDDHRPVPTQPKTAVPTPVWRAATPTAGGYDLPEAYTPTPPAPILATSTQVPPVEGVATLERHPTYSPSDKPCADCHQEIRRGG